MEPIKVVGVGPGSIDYLPPVSASVIAEADILIAGSRTLEQYASKEKQQFCIRNNLSEMIQFITHNRAKRIAVLASGDPGMFGIINYLRRHFASSELEVIPGISSMQLACAKLSLSWHDAKLTSVHGREIGDLINQVRKHQKVIVLTDPQTNPQVIINSLLEAGVQNKIIHICANLSYDTETIISGQVANMVAVPAFPQSVVVIMDE